MHSTDWTPWLVLVRSAARPGQPQVPGLGGERMTNDAEGEMFSTTHDPTRRRRR
nr:MAG TPA: hypothetical protein [Caudoviricetes sp.]